MSAEESPIDRLLLGLRTEPSSNSSQSSFEAAVADSDTGVLATLLSADIELSADGGGRMPTVLQILRGRAEVLDFIAQALQSWRAYRWVASSLNGGRGVILQSGNLPAASISFACNEAGRVTNVYIMRNPDKLFRLERKRDLMRWRHPDAGRAP